MSETLSVEFVKIKLIKNENSLIVLAFPCALCIAIATISVRNVNEATEEENEFVVEMRWAVVVSQFSTIWFRTYLCVSLCVCLSSVRTAYDVYISVNQKDALNAAVASLLTSLNGNDGDDNGDAN